MQGLVLPRAPTTPSAASAAPYCTEGGRAGAPGARPAPPAACYLLGRPRSPLKSVLSLSAGLPWDVLKGGSRVWAGAGFCTGDTPGDWLGPGGVTLIVRLGWKQGRSTAADVFLCTSLCKPMSSHQPPECLGLGACAVKAGLGLVQAALPPCIRGLLLCSCLNQWLAADFRA